MSEQSEPTLIEYARFYGIAKDPLSYHPLQNLHAPNDFLNCLEDPPGALTINESTVKIPSERIFIDAETAALIASIGQASEAALYFEEDVDPETKRYQRLKQEVPLLYSDHDCDLQAFVEPVVPDLENEFLPTETVDEEADEGLTWPTRYQDLPGEIWRKLSTERLEIPVEALRFLASTLKLSTIDLSNVSFDVDETVELDYKKRVLPEPVSPPLLPMSPEALPFVPSSDTGHLDELSEHSSPTKHELRLVESQIFAQDAIKPKRSAPQSSPQSSDPMLLDSDSLGDIYSPLKGIQNPPPSPADERKRLQQHKVEVTLTPPESEKVAPWKRKNVSFSEALTEIIPRLPNPIPDPENESALNDVDAFLNETIRPIGTKAERSIEQEQLLEADTTQRVTVPVVDFSLPVAPWKLAFEGSHQEKATSYDKFLSEMKRTHFQNHIWPLSGEVERELRWTPFPAALGKIDLHEALVDDGSLASFVALPPHTDFDTLLWEREGLRLFDELQQGFEDDLEEASFPEEKDFESLVRKRKLDLEYEAEDASPNHERCRKHPSQSNTQLIDYFSARASLEGFLSMRTGSISIPQVQQERPYTSSVMQRSEKTKEPQDLPNHSAHLRSLPAMPSPHINVPREPRSFIVSASFMKDRKLARQIQKDFSTAELIERDFSENDPPPAAPLVSRSNQMLNRREMNVDEADIILSPSTGLLWTSLQKIKQRSLPGQVARSPLRERILNTALRYERLLVLVTQDRQPVTDGQSGVQTMLDTSDCEAFTQFISFCTKLDDEIQVFLINGGMEELSRWIVALMIRYSIPNSNPPLAQEATLWEIILWKAGMNSFAAQVVLGSLKMRPRIDTDGRMNRDFGLTAFVKMSEERRFALFEGMMGGRKVLRRVSDVIEARWE